MGLPEPGQLVQVRSRRWLVEEVERRPEGEASLVQLACADDDAQGQMLRVFWECEIDRRILQEEGWTDIASKGFDPPRYFSAFLHTLQWNCVTATDARLVQAPFRAGIKIDAYQIEPLRKALQLPLVNLFIADDTGLGKTIEAGLVARELLLRKKIDTIVVSAPPSVLEQWKAELEERFGLLFEILDRQYVARMRRERGFGINPWRTHSRFLVSHNLLVNSTYADPLREWLGDRLPGSLLILDEAHHAAPSSGGRYGIESKFTRAVRDISGRFEHRLFLSATPHNGHSNSFSALLELLDPSRFTRGVKVRQAALKEVMVRRLKNDIRRVQGGFPVRRVERIQINGLPEDTPELQLSKLLDEYRSARADRFKSRTKKAQASANLLVIGLQQRLLSSIEAFARSLTVHRATVERQWAKAAEEQQSSDSAGTIASSLFTLSPGADDDEASLTDEEASVDEKRQIVAATTEAEAGSDGTQFEAEARAREDALLNQMEEIANQARGRPDAKIRWLLRWMRDNLCQGVRVPGKGRGASTGWTERRVLIFTENRQGTKRYLQEQIQQAIEGTEDFEERLAVIDGLTGGERRREIQRRFNAPPDQEPLRILLATDAAREGLNFQAHCADLFHYDLPWNPGRIEQRNGRIDRKLQPQENVRCHYFVLSQRVEDRVLDVLVRKTETIKKQLGSLSAVIDDEIERRLRSGGIAHAGVESLAVELEGCDLAQSKKAAVEEELEHVREREQEIEAQIEKCRSMLLRSEGHIAFDTNRFRDALSCSLEMLGCKPLRKLQRTNGNSTWSLPKLEGRSVTDPSWTSTLDSLRSPRRRDQKINDWRKEAPIRPVVFRDNGVLSDETVHLHLEQRLAQRLLSRFLAQGFVYDDLSRACLVQSGDSIPRVILLGRLVLFGNRAERLHEEIVAVAARWTAPGSRGEGLRILARDAQTRTLQLLESAFADSGGHEPGETVKQRLLASVGRDVSDLYPQLQARAEDLSASAKQKLAARGEAEERKLQRTLVEQQNRVATELAKQRNTKQMSFAFNDDEKRQMEADIKSWERRLVQFDEEIRTEPSRVRALYDVRTDRLEPLGVVYLWPETN